MRFAKTVRRVYVLAAIVLFPSCAHVQPEEAAVLRTVQQLFDAMAQRDSAALKAIMTADGRFATVRVTADSAALGGTSHAEFISRIGTAGPAIVERMWDPQVTINGPFAVVWAPYDLYVGEKFSHCGHDVFTLYKASAGWKITGASYTIVTESCPANPAGPLPRPPE